jgi:hypothetical protein
MLGAQAMSCSRSVCPASSTIGSQMPEFSLYPHTCDDGRTSERGGGVIGGVQEREEGAPQPLTHLYRRPGPTHGHHGRLTRARRPCERRHGTDAWLKRLRTIGWP